MLMKILCYGDSNTWGYDPRSWFGSRYDAPWPELVAEKTGWQVLNEGENGREIPVAVEVYPMDTDLLIVMLGTNDLLRGRSAEAAASRMETFLAGTEIPCLLVAPPPMVRGGWVDREELREESAALPGAYRDISGRLGIAFADAGLWDIPLTYDGVHFTQEGHRVFAERMSRILADLLNDEGK